MAILEIDRLRHLLADFGIAYTDDGFTGEDYITIEATNQKCEGMIRVPRKITRNNKVTFRFREGKFSTIVFED